MPREPVEDNSYLKFVYKSSSLEVPSWHHLARPEVNMSVFFCKITPLLNDGDWCRFMVEANGLSTAFLRVHQNQIELYGEIVLRSWCRDHREELERNVGEDIVVDLSKP
jgi:hypothetical protein